MVHVFSFTSGPVEAKGGLARLARLILMAVRRADERRTLLELDDHQLRDIGLTAHDVRREGGRWAWDGCDRSLR